MNWKKLENWKHERGLSWKDLAFESGIALRTINYWRSGVGKPDPHKLKAFMDTLERLERQQERKR